MTYQEYLKSRTWEILRKQRLAMDNHECVLCGYPAQQVHHRRYPDILGDETVNDLVSLCSECHVNFHGINGDVIHLPKPIPPTIEMIEVRRMISEAENVGDDDKAIKLLDIYLTMKRAQACG